MSWSIDAPVRIGGYAFAAIIETDIEVMPGTSFVMAHGEKRPVLFLLRRSGEVSGIDVDGRRYEAGEIEYLYPGAIGQLADLLNEAE